MPITGCTLTGTISANQNRPFTAGDGNYGRSFDQYEADAQASLTGAVVNEGPYVDMQTIVRAVCAAYATLYTDETQQQVSPFTIMCLMRDTLNLMLMNRQPRAI